MGVLLQVGCIAACDTLTGMSTAACGWIAEQSCVWQQGSLEPWEATEVVLHICVVGGSDGTAELLATSQVGRPMLSPPLPVYGQSHCQSCQL